MIMSEINRVCGYREHCRRRSEVKLYGFNFNDYISSFLTRRHNPRGQFEDTKDEEIDPLEDVDVKKRSISKII